MRDSGLAVNKAKTEVCLFFKQKCRSVHLTLGGTRIETKNVLSVFRDTFWFKTAVVTTSGKCNKESKQSIKQIITKHFNNKELLQILPSNFYSILYYNSEVWMLKNLNTNLKRSLLSTSANALKMALHYPKWNINYI